MAATVVALAAPLLLLAFSVLLEHSDSPVSVPPPTAWDSADHPTAGHLLHSVLTSQRSDEHEAAFRRHRALAERFVGAAMSHLRHISPLFANAVVKHDGGAYEDTRASNATDFDFYTMLAAEHLRQFELQRGEDGSFAVRLRSGASRADLPEDLVNMLTEDGYLDAWKFKQWTSECLLFALREAAEEQPDLHPAVYQTRGASGVNLTAADGTRVEIDFTAKLPLPPLTQESPFRPAALRPCGVPVVPPGQQPSWHLYSTAPGAGTRHGFSVDAPELELGLLRAAPPQLRDIIRLLKTMRVTHDWYHRFHITPYQLKQATIWSWTERCQQIDLLKATVSALRYLEKALRSHRLDDFLLTAPAQNVLQRRVMTSELADEVVRCIGTLTGGDTEAIGRLFQPRATDSEDDIPSL